MAEKQRVSYGSWRSPITADLIVHGTVGLGGLSVDREDIYWLESRPTEAGRTVLVRLIPDGAVSDVTPAPFNVRTRVHEYGGGAYRVHDGIAYFANFADQRLWRIVPGGEPTPLTPEEGEYRYADIVVDVERGRLLCVREEHRAGAVTNTLVAVDWQGGSAGTVLAAGYDFYSTPRLSPDGRQLAWLSWNHPNMPWDGTELWVAFLDEAGLLGETTRVAGGPDESIFQPEWSPDGRLHFVSDRTDWWNLYRMDEEGIEALYPLEAEFGLPQWVFGMGTYGFTAEGAILATYGQEGTWQLGRLDPDSRHFEPFSLPYTELSVPCPHGEGIVFLAASPTIAYALVRLDLQSREITVLRRSSELTVNSGYLSEPEAITYLSAGGRPAHAFYYRPTNQDYEVPPDERPPLLVKSHGGPTAATSSALNLKIQYWTSRGFAVLDVNYGGSTGYGRAYRHALDGQWGIVDVEDCSYGARYLVERNAVDGNRLAIDGGSAGGYTTLAALTFGKTFKAGASYYGVSDLAALATETHKFESRYLDRLIGPYPACADLYRERSPIYSTDRLSCPVIFFQGLEDRVVPPNQAEGMVEALKQKGIPVAYLAFAGEHHGFRIAGNIKRALESEYYFFCRIFSIQPGEPLALVSIDNL